MKRIKIKIGHQPQANKPIFLLHNGNIVCGKFIYKGRFVQEFKEHYGTILGYAYKTSKNGILDVSDAVYWDAPAIYDKYIVPHWQSTITAKKIERFANETEIKKITESMKPEFQRGLRSKWKKIFMAADKDDPNLARDPWEIL